MSSERIRDGNHNHLGSTGIKGISNASLVPASVPRAATEVAQRATGTSEHSRPGAIEKPEDGLAQEALGGYGTTWGSRCQGVVVILTADK